MVKARERRLTQVDGEKIRLILSELVRKVRQNLPVGSKGPLIWPPEKWVVSNYNPSSELSTIGDCSNWSSKTASNAWRESVTQSSAISPLSLVTGSSQPSANRGGLPSRLLDVCHSHVRVTHTIL